MCGSRRLSELPDIVYCHSQTNYQDGYPEECFAYFSAPYKSCLYKRDDWYADLYFMVLTGTIAL